jgi:alpha-L-fucosidase 2
MDNQILRELFAACVEAQGLLGTDVELSKTLKGMAAKLPEDKIGSKGQLLEWDREYPELTPGMGHISHLFACYPGSSINWRDTPELLHAAARSLELRVENGAGGGGWPLAWYINQYARMQDGAKADEGISQMLKVAARNFFNVYPVGNNFVFQIDGNLGTAAGIVECLLQSHVALHFLPALPPSWKDGSVTCLRARGAREVDIKWKDGKLAEAIVRPQFSGPIEVAGESLLVTCGGRPVPVEKTETGFAFDAEGGESYTLAPSA